MAREENAKEIKKVIVLCYRSSDQKLARLRALLDRFLGADWEVHLLTSDYQEEPPPGLVIHPIHGLLGRTSGVVFSLIFSLKASFSLLLLSLGLGAKAIVLFEPRLIVFAKPASLFSRTPIWVCIDKAPWNADSRFLRYRLTRGLARLGDCLQFFCASTISTSNQTLSREVARIIPLFGGKKCRTNHLSADSDPDQGEITEGMETETETETETEKKSDIRKSALLGHYGFSEKSFVIGAVDTCFFLAPLEKLIRALASAEDKNLRLVLCGEGPERTSILSISVGLGLLDQIAFVREQTNALQILAGCDLCVFPSAKEVGTDLFFRILGLGIPIFAPEDAVVRELLVHDELIYRSGHVDELSLKLQQAMQDREFYQRIKHLSAERAAAFEHDWAKNIIEQLEACCSEGVGGR